MFEWDEDKNEVNIIKHGIGFRRASKIFDGLTLDWEDTRKNYGEVRTISVGLLKEDDIATITVVHTDREDIKRIISARPANRKEKRLYEVYQRTIRQGAGEPEG